MYRTVSIFAFACALAGAGCRDNGTLQPADLSGVTDMAGGTGGGGADMAKNYMPSTIADMRKGAPGDYELDNVIAIALTPSTGSPHLYVQDAAGGDFSAMETMCLTSSTSHPCTVATTVHTTVIGDKVTIKGTYIKGKLSEGGTESFYIDSIMDNGAGTKPAPLTLTETDIERTVDLSTSMAFDAFRAKFYQMATVTPSEDLKMYEWTPTVLKYSGTWPGCTKVPYVFGFGLIPASVTGVTAVAACMNNTTPGGTQMTPDPKEILIGTDFYKDFTVSSDCQCAKSPTTVPASGTTWPKSTAMSGIVNYDAVFMTNNGYRFFSPIPSPAGAGALTGTITPP